LLYVAASRAEDRLIMSGVTDQIGSLNRSNDCWLKWIWQSLDLGERASSNVVELEEGVQLQLTINLAEEATEVEPLTEGEPAAAPPFEDSLVEAFPLIKPVGRPIGDAIHRFSVTQLINYHRCPRQYYFDRVLQLPSADELAVWNNADAPEPPSNLTATLKGAVIHRFCESYTADQSAEDVLRRSFEEVVRLRQAQLADRLVEINFDTAIKDLLPLARNYLASDVFRRVEAAPKVARTVRPTGEPGLWSELSFRLRRPLGILYGVIDKLLVTPNHIEIIDFKTNRISSAKNPTPEPSSKTQFSFDFEEKAADLRGGIDVALRTTSEDYELQMQSYALAVRQLLPALADATISVTLHFLEPRVEVHLADELLAPAQCEAAIDEAMLRIVSSFDPAHFPVKPAPHCRACNFLRLCSAGRDFLSTAS
jgi:ATP-dependent exoDNAse (exonuclease V) beta subunit